MTFPRTLFPAVAAIGTLVILPACEQSPEAAFAAGCAQMISRDPDVPQDERDAFCNCLDRGTVDLSDRERLALGALMKKTESGAEFREGLEEAADAGSVTPSGAASFVSTAKSCSLDLAT